MTPFERQQFNAKISEAVKQETIVDFKAIGFEPTKVSVDFKNGCSIYTTVWCEVVNEGKLPMDIYIDETTCGKKIALLTIRKSDHSSNLERICGGVSGNKISYNVFKQLISNKTIKSI